MIGLFDAGFLHILFDDRARVPRDAAGKPKVDRSQERIDFLVQTMSERRDKIIIPAPALAEFLLLAADRRVEYLTLIRRKSVFEIAGFDDPEAIELVDHWLKVGDGKKLKAGKPETWAKLKYDRQIIAIAVTRRVGCIYSTDGDLHDFAKQVKVTSCDLADLPLPPPAQRPLEGLDDENTRKQTAIPSSASVSRGGDGSAEGQAAIEGKPDATKTSEAKKPIRAFDFPKPEAE